MSYCKDCTRFVLHGSLIMGHYAVCKQTGCITVAMAPSCEEFRRVRRPSIKYNNGKREKEE